MLREANYWLLVLNFLKLLFVDPPPFFFQVAPFERSYPMDFPDLFAIVAPRDAASAFELVRVCSEAPRERACDGILRILPGRINEGVPDAMFLADVIFIKGFLAG